MVVEIGKPSFFSVVNQDETFPAWEEIERDAKEDTHDHEQSADLHGDVIFEDKFPLNDHIGGSVLERHVAGRGQDHVDQELDRHRPGKNLLRPFLSRFLQFLAHLKGHCRAGVGEHHDAKRHEHVPVPVYQNEVLLLVEVLVVGWSFCQEHDSHVDH